ncbi:MAG TPA: extracellular solute-binding protein, partial [Clostridia bacterium]|nr:extracellular solute-binding protein [Clostridia bacterium]
SGDYPDMMEYGWRGFPGGPRGLLEEGVIIPLDGLIADYAPNLTKIYEESPDAKKQATLDDGANYYFPFLRLEPESKAGGPILRKDWLEKLGLDLPVTMDDWHDMLVAFRDNDPNGNGEADEIPFISRGSSGLESHLSFTAPFGII